MSTPPDQHQQVSAQVRAAVGRAQWAVLQTGLITTGLALFGVFVLANRISDSHVMGLYVLGWVPAGTLLVGIIAGSGYLLAAWWFGVAVGLRLLAAIALLQLAAYFMTQYAEFQTLNLMYRSTGAPVEFIEYFRYTTWNWRPAGSGELDPPLGRWGYAVRGGEALIFCLSGLAAAVALAGKPRCPICRGQLRHRRIGAVAVDERTPSVIVRLQELAQAGNIQAFKKLLAEVDVTRASGRGAATAAGVAAGMAEGVAEEMAEGAGAAAVELELVSCAVCGCGYIEPVQRGAGTERPDPATRARARVNVNASFAAELPGAPLKT